MAKATADTSVGTQGPSLGLWEVGSMSKKFPIATMPPEPRGLRGRRGGLGRSKAHKQNGISKSEPKTLEMPGQIWDYSLACTEPFVTVTRVNRYTSDRKSEIGRAPKTLPTFLPRCVKESGQRHQDCSYLLGIQVITPVKRLVRCYLLTTHFFPSYTNKTKIKSQSLSLSMPLWKY